MNRGNRIALLAALALFVAVSGTVLATRVPPQAQQPSGVQAEEPEVASEALDADALANAIDRLAESDIDVGDVAAFGDLAEDYGIGGAVRLHAWAKETGMTVDAIAALRDGDGTTAIGWGRLAMDLGVQPGLGWIMGHGRGDGDPPGQGNSSTDD